VNRYILDGLLKGVYLGKQWVIKRADVDNFERPARGNPNFRKDD